MTVEDDAPLDPAALRLQRKLRRLMLVAGLTLGIGLLAVFAGIIYRIATTGDRLATPGSPILKVAEGAVPAGAHLVSTVFANGRIALGYEHPGGTTLILVDAATLAIVGKLELKSQ